MRFQDRPEIPGPGGDPSAPHTPEPTILHVDMNAFYASVEVIEDPSLAGRPLIVGGSGDRGVVASCSYEARAYGIHSAMPSAQARRLCPQAVFVHGDHGRYAEYSRRIHDVFASFTPMVEGVALDEAYLDVAGGRRLFGSGARIAGAVRRRVRDEVGLDSSVGVGASKLVAKLASKAAKPRPLLKGTDPGPGIVVVEAGSELAFLHPLSVSALPGVGPRTEARLARFGVSTVGDLAALPLETLTGSLGLAAGRQLHDLAWARDRRRVEPDRAAKSVGHEETYARDLVEAADLRREVVRLADGVAARLRASRLAGRTVNVKVRFHDHATITRSHTAFEPLDTGPELARVATSLLDRVDASSGVRLLGLSVSGLGRGTDRQLSLDAAAGGGWAEASRAVDEVRSRFGDAAVGPATLLEEAGLRVRRQGDQQWGPSDGAGGGGRPD
ncbi:MAG: DNA polymerase IV [Actinomycetota bacterium]|nr:DNA polymerase IV [Actinomycetota bacterium]